MKLAPISVAILLAAQVGTAWAATAAGAAQPQFDPVELATTPVVSPLDVEVRIADFERSLARIQAEKDSGTRIAAYRKSLELLDQINLDRPDFTFAPGLAILTTGYIDELNAERRKLSGAARDRNLGEAQAMVLRLDDTDARVTKALDIAQIDADSGAPEQVLASLDRTLADIRNLPTAQRDAALARAITIAARPDAELPPRAILWLEDIADPGLRARSLRQIALASAARDAVLSKLMASESLGADRDARLLDISDFLTRNGRFDAATWSAALASDQVGDERDAALALVVGDMIEAEIAIIPAVHGIAAVTLRNRVLLDLVIYYLDRDQLAEARRSAGFQTPGVEAALAWTHIGLRLADENYRQQAEVAADRAEANLAATAPTQDPRQDRVRGQLAALTAQLGRRERARALLATIADAATAAEIRVGLVESALNQYALDEALTELTHFDPGAARDRAGVLCVSALAGERRWAEAVALAQQIPSPLARLDALAGLLQRSDTGRALMPGQQVPPEVPELAREIEHWAERAAQSGARSEASARRAMARAALGAFAQARADLDEASAAERYRDALAYVVKQQTQIEGAEPALQTAALAWRKNSRPPAQAVIATAAAKRGEIETAVAIARGLDDEPLRVGTFRKIAQETASQRDDYDLFSAANSPAAIPENFGRLEKPHLLAIANGPQLFAMRNPDLGRILPPVPRLKNLEHAAVAADIPEIAPGAMHVMPLQYSDFNTKFLAAALTPNDYGGRLFYFDAQKETAFPVFLSLNDGVFDLSSIARYLRETGQPQHLVQEGRHYTLNLPLLIGPNATLVISGADVEELRLNRNSGAYLVNAGRLIVYNTRITGWDATLQAPAPLDYQNRASFRPFIAAWGGSITDIARSIITHLGFSGTKAYGLTYSSGPEVLLKNQAIGLRRPTGRVIDNSFQHMLYGFYSYEADDVAVVGNEYRDNLVYGIDPHDYSRRLLIGYNTVYGTAIKHGIIVSREVDDSWIVGNLSFDNRGSGVMLDRDSSGNLIYANAVFGNHQDGIVLFESSCNIVAANLLRGNRRDGIRSRNSWDIGLFGNVVAENQGSAISSYTADLAANSQRSARNLVLDPYTKLADLALVDNTVRGNRRGGLNLQNVANLTWKGNALVAQPKPFIGALKDSVPELFKYSDRGLHLRNGCPETPPGYHCTFKAQGFLAGSGVDAATGTADEILASRCATAIPTPAIPMQAATIPAAARVATHEDR